MTKTISSTLKSRERKTKKGIGMSERRMFSKSITESDAFLELPFSAQALYFHLSMNADDDGFINNSKRILRDCCAGETDLQTLFDKSFLIHFESGIVAVKHWKINNRIRADRKKNTNYPDEKALLVEKANGAYSLKSDSDIAESKGDTETFAEHYDCKPAEEKKAAEIIAAAESASEKAEENEKLGYESTSEPRKNYAEQIFDILFANGLPCCNGNLITFTMRDFRLATSSLTDLHLHSDDVIAALQNYAKVIDLKRKGLSWWSSEQAFNYFCEKKTILRFLPENFKLEDYYKKKDGGDNSADDRISL